MRRKIFICVLFFCSLFSVTVKAQLSEKSNLIPLTVEDVRKFQTKGSAKSKWDFIVDFYKKNKKNGATDGQILNELLKLDVKDGKNSDFVRKLSMLGARFEDLENMRDSAIEEINLKILEENPQRTDLLINPEDSSTWKNVKYMYSGKFNWEEYIQSFQTDKHYSNVALTPAFAAVLASCADKRTDKFLMSFILFPADGYTVLTQINGQPAVKIQADFTGSANVKTGELMPPFEKEIVVGGQRAFGYTDKLHIPFYVYNVDGKADKTINATITAQMCKKDGLCEQVVSPVMKYRPLLSSLLDTTVCTALKKHAEVSPVSGKAKVVLKKAYFKTDKAGETDLFIRFKLPFYMKNFTVLAKNEQEIQLSEPFFVQEGTDALVKWRVLTPDKIKENNSFEIVAGYPGGATVIPADVKTEKSITRAFLSLFSFSLTDFAKSFVYGLLFLMITPVLTAFLIFICQTAIIARKSSAKTIAFFNGLGKTCYLWFAVYAVLAVLTAVIPSDGFYWGIQFFFPSVNMIFAVLFVMTGLFASMIFDDAKVIAAADRFASFFAVFKAEDIHEKAGILTGFVTGALLLISPMTGFYHDVYLLLSQSFVFYSPAFAAGLSFPFLYLSLNDEKSEAIPYNERIEKVLKRFIPVPLYIQAGIFGIWIWGEGGASALCLLLLALTGIVWTAQKESFVKVCRFAALSLIVCLAVFPFLSGATVPLSERWGVSFDENAVRRLPREGKAVFLNVSERFCLSCHWNRWMMNLQLNKYVKNGDAVIMRIGYNHPFLKNLTNQGGEKGMPLNIMFTPANPEGKLISSYLNIWGARREIYENLPVKESASDPQTLPEQNQPEPADSGKD